MDDPPECPVCLQPYSSSAVIPRVLPCGHTACQSCLNLLPNPHPRIIRCPSCTQLLSFPASGAGALPKNIELLRLFDHQNKEADHRVRATPHPCGLIGPGWDSEVYREWKDWVFGRDAVGVIESGEDRVDGRIRVGPGGGGDSGVFSRWRGCLRDGKKVGLVRVGEECGEGDGDGVIEYNYVGRVMGVLSGMREGLRRELQLVFDVSLRSGRVCEVYGLWLDEEKRVLFMVSERKEVRLYDLIDGGGEERGMEVMDEENCVSYWVMIGLELCEVLMGLRSQGFCCGCLGLSCFALDEFGHVLIDLGEAVVTGRKISKWVVDALNHKRKVGDDGAKDFVANLVELDAFVSPEMLFKLLSGRHVAAEDGEAESGVDYSDVLLLACILLRLLGKKQLTDEMFNYLDIFLLDANDKAVSEAKILYMAWVDKLAVELEASLGNQFGSVHDILCQCLDIDPGSRPSLASVWQSLRSLIFKPCGNMIGSFVGDNVETSRLYCLTLGELCCFWDEKLSLGIIEAQDGCDVDREVLNEVWEEGITRDVAKSPSTGRVSCAEMDGHLDCVTGFCVGGGFLFSSSFDKTIIVWSLQDFTRVHTFRGHDSRIMALAFVDGEQPLCISGDNGGGICLWAIDVPFKEEPSKSWSEPKDWRYSGIHALAVAPTGLFFTGSGDRLIKAWSFQDSSLTCTLEGHKSVVSTLWINDDVLYSGSWDGTVRLWSLHDYSPLAIFGPNTPGTVSSVLSVHADQQTVIATYENGFMKMWSNDVLQKSMKVHDGAIFALSRENQWLFTGGWDKTIKVQEIHGDDFEIEAQPIGSIALNSVITTLLYTQGLLFVGCSNRSIKVYHNRA
ncbi:hypothetical protein Droror1_Dr00023346 [Drosera rotundifolia]